MNELVKAKKRALYILTESDRTEKQLHDKLAGTGYSEDVIAGTMEYVKSFGYIDDRKYAIRYIEYYRSKKSRMRLEHDLMKKGVARDIVSLAFEAAGEWDEREQIRLLAEKKLKGMDKDDPKTYRKAAAFLFGRGYRAEDISSVLKTLFRE